MATIRAYTTIEQSRKLVEFLPLESADMFYEYREELKVYESVPVIAKYIEETLAIPCWSLAALLSVLPQGYSLGNKKNNGKYYICMTCVKHDVIEYDEPVDACVAVIEKLNELNLL